MHKLILLRHGESVWNMENRFTGWTDVELSEKGMLEARRAGELLRSFRINFDLSFCSVLKRAIKTQFLVAEEMDLLWTPVCRDWRLNERHYGGLQGLNKKETAAKYGEEQVHIWRRSYDVKPPQLANDDPRFPGHDVMYENVERDLLPHGESLKDTIARVLPYWHNAVVPEIVSGKAVLIAAHGNSLRALMKHIDQISDEEIVNLEIPTGRPIVYELNDDLSPITHYYIG